MILVKSFLHLTRSLWHKLNVTKIKECLGVKNKYNFKASTQVKITKSQLSLDDGNNNCKALFNRSSIYNDLVWYYCSEITNVEYLSAYTKMSDESKDDLKPSIENLEAEAREKQSARCLLREKFLRAITSLVGKECTLHTICNTSVNGIYRGSDMEFETLLADELKTPFAEIPHSKIRLCDINFIEFKNFLNSQT